MRRTDYANVKKQALTVEVYETKSEWNFEEWELGYRGDTD